MMNALLAAGLCSIALAIVSAPRAKAIPVLAKRKDRFRRNPR